MIRTLCTVVMVAMMVALAIAQDSEVPPLALRGNIPQAVSQPGAKLGMITRSSKLPFCPPKTCLYYAGDSDSNSNGLFNANYDNSLVAQTWVGVKPTKNATVTGSTFNEFLTSGFTITNPTPFQVQVDIVQGQGGTLVCNTSGNATMKVYGESGYGFTQYSYTVKKLKRPCKMKPATVYYVNLLPTSTTGYGYVASVGAKQKNHRGWPNQPNACFFNGQAFGVDYQPCSGQGSGTLFSIALTGTE